jgi:hypothetical protein
MPMPAEAPVTIEGLPSNMERNVTTRKFHPLLRSTRVQDLRQQPALQLPTAYSE